MEKEKRTLSGTVDEREVGTVLLAPPMIAWFVPTRRAPTTAEGTLLYHAGNAVCLIVRHLAMLREEHCFTTNGLAPVNHRATIRRAQFTRVQSRHRFSRPIKRSGRRKLRGTCLKTRICTCPSAAFSRRRKASRESSTFLRNSAKKWMYIRDIKVNRETCTELSNK